MLDGRAKVVQKAVALQVAETLPLPEVLIESKFAGSCQQTQQFPLEELLEAVPFVFLYVSSGKPKELLRALGGVLQIPWCLLACVAFSAVQQNSEEADEGGLPVLVE